MQSENQCIRYQIRVKGILDKRWLRWFEGLEITTSADDQTIIMGEFDQSALHGLFNRIRDLGLELVSVHKQVSDNENERHSK